MTKFATGSEVPVQRSRLHLEQLLRAHGAEGFAYGWTVEHDRVEFVWQGQRVRFTLPRPVHDKFIVTPSGRSRSDRQIEVAIDGSVSVRLSVGDSLSAPSSVGPGHTSSSRPLVRRSGSSRSVLMIGHS